MTEAIETRLVKPSEALWMCGGLSESTVRRLIAQGAFPRPIVLSRNRHGRPVRVAFVYEELVAWVAAHIQAGRRST
jgi:predicted DNA-binding transcriptional regulator AlpA